MRVRYLTLCSPPSPPFPPSPPSRNLISPYHYLVALLFPFTPIHTAFHRSYSNTVMYPVAIPVSVAFACISFLNLSLMWTRECMSFMMSG